MNREHSSDECLINKITAHAVAMLYLKSHTNAEDAILAWEDIYNDFMMF